MMKKGNIILHYAKRTTVHAMYNEKEIFTDIHFRRRIFNDGKLL